MRLRVLRKVMRHCQYVSLCDLYVVIMRYSVFPSVFSFSVTHSLSRDIRILSNLSKYRFNRLRKTSPVCCVASYRDGVFSSSPRLVNVHVLLKQHRTSTGASSPGRLQPLTCCNVVLPLRSAFYYNMAKNITHFSN